MTYGNSRPTLAVGAARPDSAASRLLQLLALPVLLSVLAGCRLEVAVPEGGRVISDNGFVCLAGETCEVSIDSTAFDDTFNAVADSGYTFEGWREGDAHACAGSTGDCRMQTAGFTGIPLLEALLASDKATAYLVPVFQADATGAEDRYNVQEWTQFLQGLNSSTYRSTDFIFRVAPDDINCDPGEITSEAENRFLYSVNLTRRLHRLPPVQYEPTFAVQSQKSALVQMANNYLTHYPSASDNCYSNGAAAGARSSNLSYRSSQSDPAYYPLGWVNDNLNLANRMEAGHRRWVLFPQLGYTSYGQASGFASMKVFGFTNQPAEAVSPNVEYIAMPYGNYPYVLVTKGSSRTPWSLSMVPSPGVSSRFDYFSSATVSVTETASGTPLEVHSVHRDTKGFGLANFLSWMVDGWDYDIPYTVTIRNVRMQDNSTRDIQYDVEIDYADLQ